VHLGSRGIWMPQPKRKPGSRQLDTLEERTMEAPEYFLLRPEVEKAYGYTHAVRIGDDLKISGAVSMDA